MLIKLIASLLCYVVIRIAVISYLTRYSKITLREAHRLEYVYNNKLDALSQYWAWGNNYDIERLVHSLLVHMNIDKEYLGRPKKLLRLSIINLLAIIIIIIYQRITVNGSIYRECQYWPNCSNYSIGVFRRTNVISACKLTFARIKSCCGYPPSICLGKGATYECRNTTVSEMRC